MTRLRATPPLLLLLVGCATGARVDSGDGGASSGPSGTGQAAGNPTAASGPGSGSGTPTTSSGSGSPSATGASSGGGCTDPATDCPPTGSLCRVPACSMGVCTTTNAAPDTACTDSGGAYCDAVGICGACNSSPQCPGYPASGCALHQCVPATCTDGVQNGAELGVDCGGGTCGGCPDGTGCGQPTDCASDACVSSVCAPCGGVGQPCCPGGTCATAPNTCADNTFTLWGGTGQECNCGMLRPGQQLVTNETRWSCDGRFYLTMQADGDLALYYSGFGLLWSAYTTGTGANRAVMQTDGNFVVYDAIGQAWWASGSTGGPDSYLAIQGDGNAVIYDGTGYPWWSTNTCCF